MPKSGARFKRLLFAITNTNDRAYIGSVPMSNRSSMAAKNTIQCSFCNKGSEDVKRLIQAPTHVCICDECVDLCNDLLSEEFEDDIGVDGKRLPTPKEIKDYLDKYVIGQDEVKISLAVAVYNHYRRVKHNGERRGADVELQKSNVLLIGPTGSGKTLLAQSLAKLLDVPFVVADATSLTETGYVGEDVEGMIANLAAAADYEIAEIERGIIYIDEIDKIARKSESASVTRDVSGEGAQQALLKLLEGADTNVPPRGGRKHPHQDTIKINTENILFICGGAFVGIEDIIGKRLGKRAIGFREMDEAPIVTSGTQIEPRDLVQFGMIPELIGRLPVIGKLHELTEDQMVQVLCEPKNAIIRQYQTLLDYNGVKLTIEADTCREIAKLALAKKTGARGLRAILEEVLTPIMFSVPSDDTIIEVAVPPTAIHDKGKSVIYVHKFQEATVKSA